MDGSQGSETRGKTKLGRRMAARLAEAPYRGARELVLAVSGGMDSLVMLDLFQRLRHLHGAELRVFHVHHGTGEFADLALDLVREICTREGLPLVVRNYRHGEGNFEYEAARFRRHELAAICGSEGYGLLAHHERDQAETLLMALARGAGGSSPLGMEEARGWILRPFLDVPHGELAAYARETGLNWLEDPMNQEDRLFRNRIRREVLPLLRQFHGDCEARMAGWLRDHGRIQAGLIRDAERRFCQGWRENEKLLSRECLEGAPAYLRDYLLGCFWARLGLEKPKRIEQEKLSSWLDAGETGRFDLSSGRVYLDGDGLCLWPFPETKAKPIEVGETVVWGPWRLHLLGVAGKWSKFPLFLAPATPMPKQLKEFLRIKRVPFRVREQLFALECGDRHDLREVMRAQGEGGLALKIVEGPNLFSWWLESGPFQSCFVDIGEMSQVVFHKSLN